MRVSLSPKRHVLPGDVSTAPAALLAPSGARVILGQETSSDGLATPIMPSANSLFGPRGQLSLNQTDRCSFATPATTG